ncbi:hypothetical protein OG909_14045 [Streptomyces sp. NBC_01754]|uniref:hypothetical protein n=1 Tax=Streptomyces sp. NBC_01754 TaxID=2975930 RepID=UPI002DD7D448|nr:hypothetical protein [Streptomyces sp. NBC_01754]WSC93314.1 hypothetical protein OG909_14045 [Streptomyces sp. NBC_01754]
MSQQDTAGLGGCASAGLGAVTALLLWSASRRTHGHMAGGFEGEGRKISVLWTELPLVVLAGALVPTLVWLLALRLLGGHGRRPVRVLAAVVCAAVALALSAWCLHNWANPARDTVRLSDRTASDLDP